MRRKLTKVNMSVQALEAEQLREHFQRVSERTLGKFPKGLMQLSHYNTVNFCTETPIHKFCNITRGAGRHSADLLVRFVHLPDPLDERSLILNAKLLFHIALDSSYQ
jgi:hypothetical protein